MATDSHPNQRAVLITGAARRVGRVMALHMARAGWDIALHYRHSEANAQKLKTEINALGADCHLLQADLRDRALLAPLIQDAQQALPHLSALIHNASQFERADFMSTDNATYDTNMRLHVDAPFFLTQAFAKQVSRGSVLFMIDSFVRKQSDQYFTYLFSKKQLVALTEMCAYSLGPDIRVNAIAPGIVLPSGTLDEEYMQRRTEQNPLKQLGTPEAIAETANYLLNNTHLTGHIIHIDGGERLT